MRDLRRHINREEFDYQALMTALSEYANLVYGPSFVSLDSALSFHGLIPERIEALTSVTSKRPKTFQTPVGSFIYRQSPRESFHLGMDRKGEWDVAFLIATPERALADKVRGGRTQSDLGRELGIWGLEESRELHVLNTKLQ